MSHDRLGPPDRADADVRRLLRLAAPDVAAPQAVDADLDRGRAALGRRRSLLATVAVAAGTAVVAVAAVLVPQGLAGVSGSGVPASRTASLPDGRGTSAPDPQQEARVLPVGGAVPLVAGPQQHGEDVVATVVPLGWELAASTPESLTLSDSGTGEQLVVAPAAQPYSPPVLNGVGDFEPIGGAWASYYLVDGSGSAARPTIVMQLNNGRWADVSASPALGWGMAELTAFARGLRAPFTCTDPCEVPLAP